MNVSVECDVALCRRRMLYWCKKTRPKKRTKRHVSQLHGTKARRGMMTAGLPESLLVSLPPDVKGLIERMSSFISIGVNGVATTSLECMGLSGYRNRLLFWMIVPAGVILCVGLCVALSAKWREVQAKRCAASKSSETAVRSSSDDDHDAAFHLHPSQEEDRPHTLFEQMLPAVLTALFL